MVSIASVQSVHSKEEYHDLLDRPVYSSTPARHAQTFQHACSKFSLAMTLKQRHMHVVGVRYEVVGSLRNQRPLFRKL